MHLGLSLLFCLNKPFKSSIEWVSRIGVDHIEVVDEGPHELNEKRIYAIKRIIGGSGLRLSVHAPFADINIASTSPIIRNATLKRLKKSMRFSAKLDPEYWVFHPGIESAVSDSLPGLDWKINLQSVQGLLREAKHYGLKITIENVPAPSPSY